MAAFHARRKPNTYGKPFRRRPAESSFDQLLEENDHNDSPDVLPIRPTQRAASHLKSSSTSSSAPNGPYRRATASRSGSEGFGRSDSEPSTPDDRADIRLSKRLTSPKSNFLKRPSPARDTLSIFDVPISDDEGEPVKKARTSLKSAQKKQPPPLKKQEASKSLPSSQTQSSIVQSDKKVPSAKASSQPISPTTPKKSLPKQPLESAKKPTPRIPNEVKSPKERKQAIRLSTPSPRRGSSQSSDAMAKPRTPVSAIRRAELASPNYASPSGLSFSSLNLKSPSNNLGSAVSSAKKSTAGRYSSISPSTAPLIEAIDFDKFSTPQPDSDEHDRTSVSPTPNKRTALDLPDFSTPRRKRRLIDSLVPDPSQSSQQNSQPTHDQFESSDGESESNASQSTRGNSEAPPSPSKRARPDFDLDLDLDDETEKPAKRSNFGRVYSSGPKITYSSERTFLAEEVDLNAPLFGSGASTQFQELLEAADSRPKEKLSIVHEDPDEAPSSQGIKSIHELRQAGVNKRFLDEIEEIMEDIETTDANSISRRRNGFLTLAQKFTDKSFVQRFLDNGFDYRLLDDATQDVDIIGNSCLCFVAILALKKDASSLDSSKNIQCIIQSLAKLLDNQTTLTVLARDRKSNMSKYAQSQVSDFQLSVENSDLWQFEARVPVSPHLIGLVGLSTFSNERRGNPAVIGALLDGIIKSIALIVTDDLYTSELYEDLLPRDVASLELAVSILVPTVAQPRSQEEHAVWSTSFYAHLSNLLPSVFNWPIEKASKLQMLLLRLFVNMSNGNREVCDALGQTGVLNALINMVEQKFQSLDSETDETKRAATIDMLVLALCLLINLAEISDKSRLNIYKLEKPQKGLASLLDIFTRLLKQVADVSYPLFTRHINTDQTISRPTQSKSLKPMSP
jgi:hypothetical protein